MRTFSGKRSTLALAIAGVTAMSGGLLPHSSWIPQSVNNV